jgi:histidinol-phosphatase (PHP family)
VDALMKQFEDFLDEAHRLKALYADQITLLVGLETEYISDVDLEGLTSLLERVGKRVEYLVGSVHHVRTVPIDFDRPTYDKALDLFAPEASSNTGPHEPFFLEYFDAQYTLLQLFKPEIIGHFDLCRLYTPQIRLCDYPLAWQKIIRNIQYAVGYGALFEVNAAAFRKQWNTAYPGEDVFKVCPAFDTSYKFN